MANNRNLSYGEKKEDVKISRGKDINFSGAIVADPTLNSRNGMMILGRRSNRIFTNSVDLFSLINFVRSSLREFIIIPYSHLFNITTLCSSNIFFSYLACSFSLLCFASSSIQ